MSNQISTGSNISINDLGLFQSAYNTTTTMQNNIKTCQEDINKSKTTLSDESVFMGPIADSCKDALNNIDGFLNTLVDNYGAIASYLVESGENYKAGSEAAAKTMTSVLSIGSDGKITVGSTTSAGGGKINNTEYLNPKGITGSHLDFINSIKDGAIAAYEKYGVLPSLTLAQAIEESGWGDSAIGNNIFGIKTGDGWTGKTQNVLTSEQNTDGSYEQITADFRDYDSVSDSIVDHAEVLSQDRYKDVIASTNYVDACHAVKAAGYATSLDYDQKLIDIIEYNGLDQWDPK